MACSKSLFYSKQRLLESISVLTNDNVSWRFREDPAIGVKSLRSRRIFRLADGSVTVYEHRLQAWVIRAEHSTAYVRRIRAPAAVQADQAHHCPLMKAFIPRCRTCPRGSDKLS